MVVYQSEILMDINYMIYNFRKRPENETNWPSGYGIILHIILECKKKSMHGKAFIFNLDNIEQIIEIIIVMVTWKVKLTAYRWNYSKLIVLIK